MFRRVDAMQQPEQQIKLLQRGALRLDLDRLQASWNECAVELTLTELWFVLALAQHPGHVRSREQLMEAANILVDATSISTHIKRIRRKFESVDPSFDHIEAVYGMGYRWKVID